MEKKKVNKLTIDIFERKKLNIKGKNDAIILNKNNSPVNKIIKLKSNDKKEKDQLFINLWHSSMKKSTQENSLPVAQGKDFYMTKKNLFPLRYYLCSIFIKHGNISTHSFFFTQQFITVYNFICKLFDISSYLIMQKEFEIIKNTVLIGKYRNILENNQKINVNDLNFNINNKEYSNAKKIFFNINRNK